MQSLTLALATLLIFTFGRGVNATEIKVLMNDTRLLFRNIWQFNVDYCSGNGYTSTTTPGATVSLMFKGTAVSVSLVKLFDGCLAAVYLDGTMLSTYIDLVDPAVRYYQCTRAVINSTQLSYGDHNLTVLHAGNSTHTVPGNLVWLGVIDIIYTDSEEPLASTNGVRSSTTSNSSSTRGSILPITSDSIETSPPPASSVHKSVVVGGILGGLLGGLLLGVVIASYLVYKRIRPEDPIPSFPLDSNTPLSPTPYYGPLHVSQIHSHNDAPTGPSGRRKSSTFNYL